MQFDVCLQCHTTRRPHKAHGLCDYCYQHPAS
jgi:hypothetical protein